MFLQFMTVLAIDFRRGRAH